MLTVDFAGTQQYLHNCLTANAAVISVVSHYRIAVGVVNCWYSGLVYCSLLMDQKENLQPPKCIPSEDVFRGTLDKCSMIFKEPEGMTTICLSDVTIPAESKSSNCKLKTLFLSFIVCVVTFVFLQKTYIH